MIFSKIFTAGLNWSVATIVCLTAGSAFLMFCYVVCFLPLELFFYLNYDCKKTSFSLETNSARLKKIEYMFIGGPKILWLKSPILASHRSWKNNFRLLFSIFHNWKDLIFLKKMLKLFQSVLSLFRQLDSSAPEVVSKRNELASVEKSMQMVNELESF